MKFINALVSSSVIAITSSSVLAQSTAVQWTTASGGNGHWYGIVIVPSNSWNQCLALARASGGDLASLTSAEEHAFVGELAQSVPQAFVGPYGPFVGGFQDPSASDFSEPSGGWRWSDGEPWGFQAWFSGGEPSNCLGLCGGGCLAENFIQLYGPEYQGTWNDIHDAPDTTCGAQGGWIVKAYVVEYSADCNSDGIVDYGQCHDGTLPDYNSNNIPDCCEAGAPCPAGRYPVQWRTSDGGNGHWYLFAIPTSSSIDWPTAQTWAESKGGYLASLTTVAESTWCRGVVTDVSGWWTPHVNPSQAYGPWIGGYQNRSAPDYSEPSGGWRWISGETWIWPNWMPGQPDDGCGGEDYLHLITIGGGFPTMEWNDFNGLCGWMPKSLLVEWSADCNNDGIVDYGQILSGQLIDANSNGIPDICDVDPCPADISGNGAVDGVDLSVLLGVWGTDGSGGEFDADVTNDGIVNGADLTIILGGWGPCPN